MHVGAACVVLGINVLQVHGLPAIGNLRISGGIARNQPEGCGHVASAGAGAWAVDQLPHGAIGLCYAGRQPRPQRPAGRQAHFIPCAASITSTSSPPGTIASSTARRTTCSCPWSVQGLRRVLDAGGGTGRVSRQLQADGRWIVLADSSLKCCGMPPGWPLRVGSPDRAAPLRQRQVRLRLDRVTRCTTSKISASRWPTCGASSPPEAG